MHWAHTTNAIASQNGCVSGPAGGADSVDMHDTQRSIESPNLTVDLSYRDYVEAHFLRLAYAEGLMTILGGGWVTRAELSDAPGRGAGPRELLPHRAQRAAWCASIKRSAT